MARDFLAESLGIDSVPGLQSQIDDEMSKLIPFDPTISSDEAKKRNSEIVECDHCGVTGNHPNMMRWHFENCKTTLRSCTQCGGVIPRQGIKDFLYDKKKYCNRTCYMESKKGKPPITMTAEIRGKISKAAKANALVLSTRMKNNKVWTKTNRWKKESK